MIKIKSKKVLKTAVIPMALLMTASVAAGTGVNFSVASAAEDYNYYKFDYANTTEFKNAALALNKEITEEGFVLLKNDGLLPMKPKAGQTKIKTSMFGKHSANLIYCGFGSSDTWNGTVSVYDAFNDSIFELNPTLKSFYNDNNASGNSNSGHDCNDSYYMGMPVYETPVSRYTKAVKDSFSQYNELAVVFLSRTAGEGTDMATTSLKQNFSARNDENKQDGARHWDDHYLQLNADEVAMLQMVMDNFDDILICMNGASYIELGFLDDPTHYLYTDNGYTTDEATATAKMSKFKALINVNMPGSDGICSLPKIMDGTVNPSGHLVDTWVRNMKDDPTYQNAGTSGQTFEELRYGEYYVHYDEDIYMGYRYYETRYETEGENGDDWYKGSVMYPFGYGLSYTDFSWQMLDEPENIILDKDGKITAKVRVTNTGDVAGKEVVQLYYNAPYFTGGISKAHVVLGGFKKTGLLQPGEHEDVTVEMDVRDMRSYDWSDANENGIKGYELDAGTYNIILAHDAHDAAKLPGDRTVAYTLETGVHYATDAETGAEVKNLFDYSSGTGKTNDPEKFKGVRQYLSRDDFEGTFPTHSREKQSGLRQGKQQFVMSEQEDMKRPWYEEDMPRQAETAGTSSTNEVKLWHMKGRDYDDPLWDELLDQLTIEEMASQIGNGFRGPREIASIDKPTVWDTDGPLGRRESTDIQWAANTILAQTYNTELAYREGVMFGNTIFTGPNGRGGTYGVGLDIHRSPFAGRYFEYYSEDGWLSGIFGAEVIKGSNTKGCYHTIKHLMLNDMETQRNTIQTWASEQAIREIYGKGFELGIKAGSLGIMTGVNSIGDIPCALNYNLLTALVRDEWGFEGFIITDMYCEDTNICIRAGIDTMMSYPNPKNPSTEAAHLTSTHVSMMRKAVKNIFFAMANSSGVNGVGGERLDRIKYTGADALYTVANVDNELSVATANVASNENAQLKYSLKAGSELPAGMTLNSDGTITGTPSESGTFNFSVTASEDTRAHYPYKDVSKNFRLTVYAQDKIPDNIIYEDVDLGVIPYGYEYSKSIKNAAAFDENGKLSSDIEYKLVENSVLPEGLELKDGIISGTAKAAPGTYFFTVEASKEGKTSATLDFIVKVKAYSISYEYVPLDDMTIGKPVNVSVANATTDDGIQIKYALKDGDSLPKGLVLSSTGSISGIPQRAYNDFEFTIVASGDLAVPKEVTYSVNVAGVVFDDAKFENLIIGKDYSFKLSASANNGSESQIYYELKEGSSLPRGMKLLADGTLFGSGLDWGTQTFTVVAKSEGNVEVEATVTMSFYTIFETPVDEPPAAGDGAGCGASVNGNIFAVLLPAVFAVGGIMAINKIRIRRNKK